MGETLGATFDVGNMVTQTRKREGKSSKIIPLQLSKRQGNLHAKYKFGALKKQGEGQKEDMDFLRNLILQSLQRWKERF